MRNEKYENILHQEILVDCKDEYDLNMNWYYFVQDELEYPFEAAIEIKKRKGGKILKKVKVIDLATDDSNFERNFDLKVEVGFDEYFLEIPLMKLTNIVATERTAEIIEVWKYWVKK